MPKQYLMRHVFFLLLTVVAGCVSNQVTNDDGEIGAKVRDTMSDYFNCMMGTGHTYAVKTKESAGDIADAAQGKCSGQYLTYQQAVIDELRSRMSYGNDLAATNNGRIMASETQADFKQRVKTLVFEVRDKGR